MGANAAKVCRYHQQWFEGWTCDDFQQSQQRSHAKFSFSNIKQPVVHLASVHTSLIHMLGLQVFQVLLLKALEKSAAASHHRRSE
jgi:hypothetical protein